MCEHTDLWWHMEVKDMYTQPHMDLNLCSVNPLPGCLSVCTLTHSDDEEVCWPRNVGAGTHLQAHTKCTEPLAGPLCVPTEARGSRPLNPEPVQFPP